MYYQYYKAENDRLSYLYTDHTKGHMKREDPEATDQLDFIVRGKTYAERKAAARQVIRHWIYTTAPVTYIAGVDAWIVRNARHYGLVRELAPVLGDLLK